MSDDKQQQDLATQIKNHHRSGEFDKALEISKGAVKSNPPDLEAYDSRWELIAEMFSEADATKTISPEIETLLKAHPETPKLLNAAYWGYMHLPGRTKNVPNKVRAIPKFIFIDKNGYWQYNFGSSNIIDGQPLIWLIESLLSD